MASGSRHFQFRMGGKGDFRKQIRNPHVSPQAIRHCLLSHEAAKDEGKEEMEEIPKDVFPAKSSLKRRDERTAPDWKSITANDPPPPFGGFAVETQMKQFRDGMVCCSSLLTTVVGGTPKEKLFHEKEMNIICGERHYRL